MEWWEAILLGAVEGFTEFLPVSSTGHLTILESVLGQSTDDPDITAFTAIIQVGAVAATVFFLRHDIIRILRAWFRGLAHPAERGDRDYRFGWAVILGSLPIGVVGLVFQDEIETTLRSLWFVAGALVVWSGVMWFADHAATQVRHEKDVTWKDTLIIGTVQCLALIPGISRSGATISAGLLAGFDRTAAARFSFLLSIPAVVLSGLFELKEIGGEDGASVGATVVATVAAFVSGYAAIAWLLRYLANHSLNVFVVYRIPLGILVITLAATGAIS